MERNKKLAVVGLIALIAIIATSFMFLRTSRGPAGTVVGFYSAIGRGDFEGAAEYLPAEERDLMLAEFENVPEEEIEMMEEMMEALNIDVNILDETIDEGTGTATVKAEITTSIDFMGIEETETETITFELEKENGNWVIVDTDQDPMAGF